MGRVEDALGHLSRAAQGNVSPGSYTSLADLLLQIGNVADAKVVMAKYPGSRRHADSSYDNVMGHIALAEGDIVAAERAFRKCKEVTGEDVVWWGSMAKLRITEAKRATEMLAYRAAKQALGEALEFTSQGLTLRGDNPILLRLDKDIRLMKEALARREQSGQSEVAK
jgi:hypothetical protein